jgi:HAD superfamily hydrolase (TIGR01662 family)
MKVEAVLFDLFDTLLLIEGGDAFYMSSLRKLHESLTVNGVNVSFEQFRSAYVEAREGLFIETDRALEEPHFNVRVSRTLQKLGYNFKVSDEVVVKATEAFSNEFMRYTHLDEDAKNVLQQLHEKYKLGIVSNFAIPECVWKLLEKYGLKEFFKVVVISGAVNRRKPSPKIFEKALEAIDSKACQTVFVGDTLSVDVRGAKNVGMKTILIERKPTEKNADIQPDKTIKRLDELLTVL